MALWEEIRLPGSKIYRVHGAERSWRGADIHVIGLCCTASPVFLIVDLRKMMQRHRFRGAKVTGEFGSTQNEST